MTGDRTRTDGEAEQVGIFACENEPKTMSDAPTVPMKDGPFEDWLYGQEGYGIRAERLSEELRDPLDKIIPWLRAAYEVGQSAPLGGMGGGEDQGSSAKEADTQPGASLTVLVPREPTEAMVAAGVKHIYGGSTFGAEDRQEMVLEIWSAMIAATQQATGEGEWTEFEDDLSDAIADSIDMDWNSRDGAKAVVRWLNENAPRTGKNLVGAAEREVGQAVYQRIEQLMDGNSPELAYLAELAESVEEYGSYSGPTVPLAALSTQQAVSPAEGVDSLIKGDGRE